MSGNLTTMDGYDYESMLARLREDYEEGEKTLEGLGLRQEQLVQQAMASTQHQLLQAESRSAQLEEELDEVKSAYLKSADLANLAEPELVAVLTKFGGQDVTLLHADIVALQARPRVQACVRMYGGAVAR